jgi:prophage regulatory protein
MVVDRISPRGAFASACNARWLFGEEVCEKIIVAPRAASQETLNIMTAFMAAVADGHIRAYADAGSTRSGFPIDPDDDLIDAFVNLTAEATTRDPWPTTPAEPSFLLDSNDVERFIAAWLADYGMEDMRIETVLPMVDPATEIMQIPPTNIAVERAVLSAAPTIERHLLRLPEVKRLTGLSKTAIYARMHDADFPQKRYLGPQTVAWFSDEVATWISSRK